MDGDGSSDCTAEQAREADEVHALALWRRGLRSLRAALSAQAADGQID
jgi:hypothetical protein